MAARGAVAEWLGRGLQSLVHQFDSGRRLFDKRAEPGSARRVSDGFHRALFVQSTQAISAVPCLCDPSVAPALWIHLDDPLAIPTWPGPPRAIHDTGLALKLRLGRAESPRDARCLTLT